MTPDGAVVQGFKPGCGCASARDTEASRAGRQWVNTQTMRVIMGMSK